MKRLLIIGLLALAVQACMPTARMSSGTTESYIKNYIEQHAEGQFSNIKVLSLYQAVDLNRAVIEFTGVKYKDAKILIVSARHSFTTQTKTTTQVQKTVETDIVYVPLTYSQAKSIKDNYTTLQTKIKAEQPKAGETVYHDFTASEKLFVSFSRRRSVWTPECHLHERVAGGSKIHAFRRRGDRADQQVSRLLNYSEK